MSCKINTESQDYKIGQRVFEARMNAGMSQMELAEAAGLDRKTIYRVENGGGTYFSNMVSIAPALNLTTNSFCTDETVEGQDEENKMKYMFSRLNKANQEAVKKSMLAMMECLLKAQK